MAGRIAGITIEIGGDTTNLQKSLKEVDSQLKTTQSNLKDINKLLKLDPGNTELLRQKQTQLKEAISQTKDRLQQLKDAQSGVAKGTPEWDRLQREIIETEQNLQSLEGEYREFGSVAKQQLQAVGSKLQEAGGKITDFGQKLAPLSGAAAGLGTALAKLGLDAGLAADDLNTLAKQTGFSTDTLQKMKYASDLIDVSVEDMAGALKKLKPKITEDNKALADLGVSTTDTNGNLRDAESVFFDVVEALSKIDNETERDQAAMEIFGKSADSLAGIIDDGGAALRDYGQQAEDLGLILSGDTLNALNETNDTVDKMKAQIRGTMAVIGAKVLPVLAPILEKGAELIGKIAEKLQGLNEEQTETILKVIGVVAAAAPAIMIIGKIVSGVGTLISAAGSLLGLLGNPAVLIIAALVAAGILLYKNWDKIKAVAEDVKKRVTNSWNNLKTSVTNAVTAVKTKVVTTWNNIKTGVTTAVESLKAKVSSVWDALKAKIATVIDGIKSKIDTVKSVFNSFKETVSSVVQSVKDFFNFKFELPHIKLPHFTVEPAGWVIGDLLKGIIPKLSIQWYKKAYDNPMMFTSPTVMATPNGMKGFGDGHGAEIVLGLNKLRELVGSTHGDVTINIYSNQNPRAIAEEVQKVLVNQQMQRNRAYA